MKFSAVVICVIVSMLILVVSVTVNAQSTAGPDAAAGLQGTEANTGQSPPGAQSMPAAMRIRSDAPAPEPTLTPVMIPMQGMGPASGYSSMPMGMGSMGMGTGSTGYGLDPYAMASGGSMSGMGMGMCPMMSMMGGMGMTGGAMGYGMPGYYNSSMGFTGTGNSFAYNGSYPMMGSGMMGYGGYSSYGYNRTYPGSGYSMMGAGYAPGGSCGSGSGMMGYGYNATGYNSWPSGPMMGMNGFSGGYGMMGGWDVSVLSFYGILYGILVPLMLISWTIVGILASIYLVRKMPPSSR